MQYVVTVDWLKRVEGFAVVEAESPGEAARVARSMKPHEFEVWDEEEEGVGVVGVEECLDEDPDGAAGDGMAGVVVLDDDGELDYGGKP